VAGAAIDYLFMNRVELVALGLHGRPENRIRNEVVDRQDAENGIEHGYDTVAIEADQPPCMFDTGIVAVNDGDFVAMPHGA